jgi:hypothetical protein
MAAIDAQSLDYAFLDDIEDLDYSIDTWTLFRCLSDLHDGVDDLKLAVLEPQLLWDASRPKTRDQMRPRFLSDFKEAWTRDIVVVPAGDGIHWCLTLLFPRSAHPYRVLHIETYKSVVQLLWLYNSLTWLVLQCPLLRPSMKLANSVPEAIGEACRRSE